MMMTACLQTPDVMTTLSNSKADVTGHGSVTVSGSLQKLAILQRTINYPKMVNLLPLIPTSLD